MLNVYSFVSPVKTKQAYNLSSCNQELSRKSNFSELVRLKTLVWGGVVY